MISSAVSALEKKMAENAALEEMAKKQRAVRPEAGTQMMRKELGYALLRVYLDVVHELERVQEDSERLMEELTSHGFGDQKPGPPR